MMDDLQKLYWSNLEAGEIGDCNLLRMRFPDFRPNFSGHDFRGLNLDGIDLSFTDLTAAFFSGMTIRSANFSHASMPHAAFLDSVLIDTRFDAIKTKHLQFMSARAFDCNFDNAEMVEANLAKTVFIGGHFYNTNLADAHLTEYEYCLQGKHGGAMTNCNFQGADLRNARVPGILFGGSDFRNAKLDGADFRLTNLRVCQFGAEQIRAANLAGAHILVPTKEYVTEARLLEVLPRDNQEEVVVIPTHAPRKKNFITMWHGCKVRVRTLSNHMWNPRDINYLGL